MYIYGMPVILNELLVDTKQVRFPKTKKKRIRKKWSKQSKNYKITPKTDVFIDKINQVVYAHPETAKLLRQKLDEQYKPIYTTQNYRKDFPFKWEAIA